MESYVERLDEESRKQDRKTGPGESPGTLLGAKMKELAKLREKLTKAKDEAVQSWLDSKPLIDELEKLRSKLEDAKSRTTPSNTAVPELETQLETLNASIRAHKEEELKIRTRINKINQVLQRTQEEMEQLKIKRDEKHRARLKHKQVLRLRRQTVRTLQLTLRAVRLESEGYGASADEANRYINHSQMDDTTVKLTQEEYRALTKRAREETSLAEWRVSVSTEQKQVAKESKDSAAKKIKEMQSVSGSKKRVQDAEELEHQIAPKAEEEEEEEELHPNVKARSPDGLPKNKANSKSKFSKRKPKERSKTSRSTKKNLSKRKKSSCFTQIRALLIQKIKKFF